MQITVSVRAESLIARLNGAPGKMRSALVRATNRLAIQIQRSVKAERLTGQVLHVRTGTLRRSINQQVTETADGVWGIVGTNVKYAAAHEYGFSGTVDVRAHVRARTITTTVRGSATFDPKTGKMRKGRAAKLELRGAEHAVRAHTRNVNLPERSFLRSTLRDYEPKIRADLREAALSVIK